MKERKNNWKEEYSTISRDQTLDLNNKSPENFIDEVKLKYLMKYLPKSGVIVEIGAGSGRLLTRIALENRNLKFVGIDFETPDMIKSNIVKFNINGSSICADAYHLPIKTSSVESVISGGLLEHFDNKEIQSILSEMKRILKPKGIFYAEIVPNKKSLCRPIIVNKTGGFESKNNMLEWDFILNFCGFKNVKVVSGVVIPPNFYVWFREGIVLELTYKFKYLIEHLDNTIISDILGFSYYITAEK